MRIHPATPLPVRAVGTWLSRADAGLVRGAVANAAVAVVDEQRRRRDWTTDETLALLPAVPRQSRPA